MRKFPSFLWLENKMIDNMKYKIDVYHSLELQEFASYLDF